MATQAGHGYQQLDVYRRALALVRPIHDVTSRFPDYERFELASQMRRACKSIPANIAEGHGKRTSARDFCNFLTIALGSTNEMYAHFDIAFELGYISEAEKQRFVDEYKVVARQLTQLIRYWRTQQQRQA
ncbi:MAG TPA: four helix bundle protein [Dehalococcoidia bacterium]|nr:four helix bundle protein [Dehalococcoidia bacterium]